MLQDEQWWAPISGQSFSSEAAPLRQTHVLPTQVPEKSWCDGRQSAQNSASWSGQVFRFVEFAGYPFEQVHWFLKHVFVLVEIGKIDDVFSISSK